MLLQTTGKRMGQIVRFELDEQETPAPQTQVQLPVSSPISLTDEEERMSRDSNAEIRQKAHQVLESLMSGNARFRKVCHRAWCFLLLRVRSQSVQGKLIMQNGFSVVSCILQSCKGPGKGGWLS